MGKGSLALLDYRRQVAGHYARLREADSDFESSWRRWRADRDELFKRHSESPLTDQDRAEFTGLSYFDYDPSLRYELQLQPPADSDQLQVRLDQDGELSLQSLGALEFSVNQVEVRLTAYWLGGYGGGVFLPFRDGSNGESTYGGGRYLLDTIKGADLGSVGDRLILDFNFAYNPSCAYNPHWHCPLAPPANWLEVKIEAGEKEFKAGGISEPDPTAIPESTS